MIRECPGNPVLVTTQINAESGPQETAAAAASDPVPDAWDRLAALAFDQTSAHVGCSARASECTCRAEHAEHDAASGVVDPARPPAPAEPPELSER